MLVLVVVVLVLLGQAAKPFGTFFFLLLLEDLDLDAGESDLDFASVSTDDLTDSDALIDSRKKFNVLFHVNVGAPAVSNPEESLLEHDQAHSFLAAGVVDPLLGDLSCHLLLAVERQQDLVDTLEKRRVLVFGDNVAGAVGAGLRVQQLPVAGANTLELSMHKQSALVCLAHDRVHLESFTKQESRLECRSKLKNRRACYLCF